MGKHTAIPWRLRKNPKEAPDDMIVMNEEGASICDCSPGNPYMTIEEAKANAEFIALACSKHKELLEAATDAFCVLVGYVEGSFPGSPFEGSKSPFYVIGATEAVAKLRKIIEEIPI